MKNTHTREKQTKDSQKTGFFHAVRSRLEGWFQSSDPENELIDYVVDIIEPKLKLARNYRKRLREPLKICKAHCRAMVTEIPGPIRLGRNGHASEPFIRAVFTKSEYFEELLNRADYERSSASLPGTERVALLTMSSKERTIFGRKRFGDMMIADAMMRSVTFTDHTLVGLSTTLQNARKALERYTLDVIAEAAARELSEARTRLVDLNQRQERLRAMEKMFGKASGAGMGCVFVPYDPEKSKKQKEIEQLLAETEDEIASARSGSETADDWLTMVKNLLSKPEDMLNMRLITLRLNWKNVLTDDPGEKADTITFATFTLADEMQREGVLVEYDLN